MPSDEQPSSLETATRAYEEDLEAVLPYLADRGIDETAARTHRLGYVARPRVGHEQMVGRLAIPFRTRAGVRTIRFRALDDSQPKYLSLPGDRGRMFNPSALFDTDLAAICEGELDAVVCSSVVGVPAVGVPGVSAWKPHFPRMFAGIPRVLVVIDHDVKENGRNPGRELGDRVANALDQAVIITPPEGMDLTDWVLQDGVEIVRKGMGL